ncbi:MAG: AAA family ATPase [Nitrospira sp.]|nr:AAA family ATPase [Nitrospira sp.]
MVTKAQTSSLFKGEPDTQRKEIWAVGGGKGGTGKTFLAANLGLCLSKLGKRVLLVDADLGCANLHTALGMSPPSATLSDFLKGKGRSITDVLSETGIPNLSLISGAQDFLEIANPKYGEKLRLIRQIQELDFEYIILDLGAGTSFTILDFFLISDHGILTVLPEPTSIENVYRFIKSAFYRRFKKVVKDPQIREIITRAMDQKNELGIRTPHDLIQQVGLINPMVGGRLQEAMSSFTPKLIVNQVRTKDDIALGFSMRSSCSKYFGIQVEYLGYIEYDDYVWQATKKKRALLLEYPYSGSARCLEKVTHNLLTQEQLTFDLLIRK